MESFLASVCETDGSIRNAEDALVNRVGRDLYLKFFLNYTRKQWGLDPSALDAQVVTRIPVRTNRDDRYFTDRFQAMPKHGFTRLFENLLDHSNISIWLNTDYRDIVDEVSYRSLIYTGPIDEFFDYRFGKLPYRSLTFQHETHDCERFQPAAVINFPNEHRYTRITEFKYLTGQQHRKTSIAYEFPQAHGDPYYPIPQPATAALYAKYRKLTQEKKNVHFVGRLATYKYYNMDQVIAQALTLYKRIRRTELSIGIEG
jgi:UDP-galactopyranose mutase